MTRKQASSVAGARLLAAWLLTTPILLGGCGPKVPPAPPEFDPETRAPTGDNRIEERIIRTIRLEQVSDQQLQQLEKLLADGKATDVQLADYLSILVQRGRLKDALNHLHRRSVAALGDASKVADSLGLAMGQRRWSACVQMASDYLSRRRSHGVFMIRGLCRARSGSVAAARSDYQKASEILAIDSEVFRELLEVTERRASANELAPASDEVYGRVMGEMMQRGILDRLFVQHLLGRYETTLTVTSLNFGSLNNSEIRQVVLSRSRSYRQCYAMARAERPWRPVLKGSVTLEFLISPMGRVRNVEVADDGWQGHHAGAFVNDCLTGQLEALRFPGPRYSMAQRARHRFRFSD